MDVEASGDQTFGSLFVKKLATANSSKIVTAEGAGDMAVTSKAHFPLAVIFDSTMGLWLQELFVSCDGCDCFDGSSAC